MTAAGCTQQPKSDMARISGPEDLPTASSGTTYEIDTATSLVTWVGTNPTGRHNGIFKIKNGSITVSNNDSQMDSQLVNDQEKLNHNQINLARITIDIKSVDILDLKHDRVQYNKLLKHLKSDDFFQADKYPEAIFELISIEKIEEDTTKSMNKKFTLINPTHQMKGNLTIKGITKSIEFPVRLDVRNLKLEASAKFNIDRTAWDINHLNENDPVAKTRDSFINNIVNVGFEIIAYSKDP
jgi:polyisoprenoid-binding protein YceI